jgi:hypothetical protein
MADTSGTRTLEDVVQILLVKTRRNESDYDLFLQLAIDGYRELRLHHVREGVKVVKKTPTSINTVDYPSDYISFVAIGVPLNGKLWTLSREDEIITTTTLSGGQETLDSSKGEGVDIPDYAWAGYGASGGNNIEGYYTLDDINRRIVLNSVTKTEVLLYYVSSGTDLTGTTYVPTKYVPALEAYIMYEDIKFDRNIPSRIKQDLFREWQRLSIMAAEVDLPTLSEIRDEILKTTYPLPRR